MSGGSRNQVEFNRELASFFGPVTDSSRNLRVVANDHLWEDRPLTPKTTSFGVDIWRLSLPTATKGGFEYPETVLKFRRCRDRKGIYFELEVSEEEEPSHKKWRAKAHRFGYVGLTSGQRAYGFYG